MQPNIHPHYHLVKFTCTCGHSFMAGSTLEEEEFHLEVCGKCHPFFTKQLKVLDTARRVERFNLRYGKKDKANPK